MITIIGSIINIIGEDLYDQFMRHDNLHFDNKEGLVHMGSQVLSPMCDMDTYMATLLGGEAWNLY